MTEMTVKFPYRRSLGPVLGAFMTGLTEQKIIGIRSGERVIVPPLEWEPTTGAQLDAMSTGMRVAPRWKTERIGHITDIDAFIPGETPETHEGGGADEPVTMMEYDASIHYSIPVPTNVVAAEAAAEQGRFLGLKCPICSRTYTGGRGFCPIDSVELTSEHEVDLPHTGVLTNYTIITPTQYPGQTATEPFARVHIWLDDTDVVLGYQSLLEVPVEDVHIGIRVKAVWDIGATQDNPRSEGGLLGFAPTGEPDNTDPTLVNKLH
jgi:uncharacterized OB-fold protein